MKRFLFPFAATAVLLSAACSQNNEPARKVANDSLPAAAIPVNEHLLESVLWFEQSGEMKALYYQSYSMARLSLDQQLASRKKMHGKLKTPAVVVDVDETVLDNSPFEGTLLNKNLGFSDSLWNDWVNRSAAKALPGALEFLNYAKSAGAEVFYISNRKSSEVAATMKNLQQDGFPFADEKHMLFRDGASTKEPRRLQVAEAYDILILCGDNLADLSSAFDDRALSEKTDSVDAMKNSFGSRYIILPNPMYGDWEKPCWQGKKLNDAQRDSARMAWVKGY